MNSIECIRRYEPCCEQEERDKAVILDYLDRNPGCFSRSDLVAHMTASSWVVNRERTKVLMVYHKIREETGVEHVRALNEEIFSLEVLTVDGHEKHGEYVPSHLHLNVTYLLEADENDTLHICAEENAGVRWFTLDEALKASTEPWFVERIYKKLNEKVKNCCG